MLYLVEHFYSIQGEGRYTGVPSLFFRFGGCNMRCEGFKCTESAPNGSQVTGCDTVYAVSKEHFGSQWFCIEHADELRAIMDSYTLPPNFDVVMTGGEPLIYADNGVFVTFVQHLVSNGHRVTFETNGAMRVNFDRFPVYRECVFALSVKLSNSAEPYDKRVRPGAFVPIARHAKEAFFKFTIDKDSIGANMEHEIDDIVAFSPDLQVYCMPMGGSREEIEANTQSVIDFCKVRGYTYSDRLHIRIWDANKGV
ncbi:MAG TPA: 7-carboxy-7-deazaguanine synthase QueE [Sulfuricurvum sp.]|nr:7-carboxy-7-deazaguanine synthase QueE [Sulfuricurvum sp.]